LQVNITGPCNVRDLYEHKDLGAHTDSFEALVNPGGVVIVKLTKSSVDEWVLA